MALKFLNNGYFAGKVGIGTDSPSSNLDIEDASGVTIDINSSSGDGMFRFQDDGTTKWAIGRDNTQQNFVFSNSAGLASDNVLTLAHSTGNVGIGTASPSRKLHIHADSGNAYLQLTQAATGTTSNDGFQISMGTGQVNFINRENGNMVFETNNTERMRITNTGNVGIGTTSPSQKLDVVGGFIRSISTGANLVQGAFVAQSSTTDSPGYRGQGYFTYNEELDVSWYMGTPYTNGDMFSINRQNTTTSFDTGAANMNGTNVDNFFAIKNNGNVGIGTTSPDNLLTIESSGDTILQINRNDNTIGGGNRTGIIQFGAKGTWGTNLATSKIWSYAEETFTSTANGTSLRFFTTELGATSPTEKMIIDTNGNVGIGTTSPGSKLEVNSGGSDSVARFTSTDARARILISDNNDISYFGTYIGTTFLGPDDTPSGNTINVLSNGNVGIGTTSPGLKLDINSGTANSALRVLSTDRYTGIKFEDVSNNDTLFYDGQSDLMYLGSTNFRAVDLHAAGNLRVEGAIYDSNNSPGTANQVLVSTVTGTDWVDGSGSSIIGGPYLPLAGGTMTGDLKLNDAVVAKFGTGDDLRIQHTGNQSYIQNYTGDLQIQNRAADKDILFRADDGSGVVTSYLVLDGSTTHAYFSNPGNVGIGTTSPDANLEVESASGGVLRLTSSDTTVLTGESIGKIEFKSNDASTSGNNVMGFIDSVATNVGTRYALSFGTGDAAAAVERMRITNLGGISFGSTGTAYGTSGQILKSNGNASPTWIDGSAIPGVPAGSGTTNYLARWTPDGDTLGNSIVFDNGTNVGIGTSSVGTYKLNVDGAIRIGVSGTIQPLLSRDSSTGGLIVSSVGNSGDFIFQGTGGSEKFRIKDTGNVGIGTTSPDFKLDVNGIIRSENSSEVGTLYLGNTAQSQIPGGAIIGQRSPSYSSTGNLLFQVPTWGAGTDYGLTTQMSIEVSTSDTKKATISMIPFGGNVEITNALLSNQENTDVDTGAEVVAQVSTSTYTAAFFDFVIKKVGNIRSGTVYACHDGTNVEFTETSTNDLGDTSDVTLSVDKSGTNLRLIATVTSDDWIIKSLIRAI